MSRYAVIVLPSAEKDIRSIPKEIAQKVFDLFLKLEVNPRMHGSKKLRGDMGYRVKVADYRVVYTVEDIVRIVRVVRVRHRKEVYRDL